MAENGPRKVRGVGFGDIFSGKKEITLRTAAGRNDDEAQDNIRSIAVEKTDISRPPNPAHPQFRARCTFEYKAEFEDELPLAVGDIVTVLDGNLEDEGWWKGQLSNGRIGVFPNNFVEVITDDVASPSAKPVVDASQPKAAESAAPRTPEAPLQMRKAPDTAPPVLAKSGVRAGAPPISTKPQKGPAKSDNPTLAQSQSTHVVNTPFESPPPKLTADLDAVKQNGTPNTGGIRERLERLNLAASVSNHPVPVPAPVTAPNPAPVPVPAPVVVPAASPLGLSSSASLRKDSVDKSSMKKADDSPKGGKFWKKKSGSASRDDSSADLDVKVEASTGTGTGIGTVSEEPSTLQSLTKGRPKVPRLFRKLSKNAGRTPSVAVDEFDYTLPDMAPSTSTSAEKERVADTKPAANSDKDKDKDKRAAAIATESFTSTPNTPPVAKNESGREFAPPTFKETPPTAVAAVLPNVSQQQRPAIATPVTAVARPSITSGGDETKRLDEAISDLRRELTTLRDENSRLDRRVAILERELDEERRARQTLAIEIDVLKTKR